MHVIDMILFWADMEPGRPAIMLPDRMLTFRGLASAIDAISARLAEHKLDKSKLLAVTIENEDHYLAACLAALRLGISVAPASPSLLPQLVASGITHVITDGASASGFNPILFDDSWLVATSLA